jgi:hypothetical protein
VQIDDAAREKRELFFDREEAHDEAL